MKRFCLLAAVVVLALTGCVAPASRITYAVSGSGQASVSYTAGGAIVESDVSLPWTVTVPKTGEMGERWSVHVTGGDRVGCAISDGSGVMVRLSGSICTAG